MSDIKKIVTRYLDLWNEQDPAIRRAAIEEIFTADATYTDPLAAVAGHDGIDALIAGAQAQFPGFGFRQLGEADAHHDIVRFTWELGPEGVEAPVAGFDVAVLDDEGRIRAVHGFLDKVPA
ncbi:nuclear transport factor 2 family protein [Streptosporangium sp. NPDC000396]|uniref:nuclear transport factor 2 family protein n=1 Tax=Streptosporangium sp. NPDC000396 TaxID=3366185 RepID=UPI0036CC6153